MESAGSGKGGWMSRPAGRIAAPGTRAQGQQARTGARRGDMPEIISVRGLEHAVIIAGPPARAKMPAGLPGLGAHLQ